MTVSDAIERFLGSGEHDPGFAGWPGSMVERRRQGTAALRNVLCRVVGHRAAHAPLAARRIPVDAGAQVRARVEPMLRGLFPAGDAERLVAALPPRVVVLTPGCFGAHIDDVPLHTAWDLANLLLDDLGAPPLADDIPELDGLCAAGRAWVLPRAFTATVPFTDVVVHEVAHLLHTLQPADVGLAGAPGPLLAVPPRRRETFAYACEAWATLAGAAPEDRHARVDAFRATRAVDDARVDRARLDALLVAGAGTGNGWGEIRAWAVGSGRADTHAR
jgi:hypothetical protein